MGAVLPLGRGYIGTELLKDVEIPGRYLVIDRWDSSDAYNAFVEATPRGVHAPGRRNRLPLPHELRFGTFESSGRGGAPGARG